MWLLVANMAGYPIGTPTIIGGKASGDFATVDSVVILLSCIRTLAKELSDWVRAPPTTTEAVWDRSKDVVVTMLPLEFMREGTSAGVPVFLALMKLFYGCRLKAGVAAIGVVSLCGYVLSVGSVVEKIKAALDFGAKLVLVPLSDMNDVAQGLTAARLLEVSFVDNVEEVLSCAIASQEGSQSFVQSNQFIVMIGSHCCCDGDVLSHMA